MDLKQLSIKSDSRGSLIEAFNLPTDGAIFYVIAKAGETRGNHYHLAKTEHFLVMYGSATITVKNRTTSDVMTVEVNGGKPIMVSIFPNHTHRITASDEGAIFMVWTNTKFNKKNPDTFPEEI